MRKSNKMAAGVAALLILIAIIVLGLYGYDRVQYSHGRKGAAATITSNLQGVFEATKRGESLESVIAKIPPVSVEWSAYSVMRGDSRDQCHAVADACVVATSKIQYRGRPDVFVLSLSSGEITQVEFARPSGFIEWALGR